MYLAFLFEAPSERKIDYAREKMLGDKTLLRPVT